MPCLRRLRIDIDRLFFDNRTMIQTDFSLPVQYTRQIADQVSRMGAALPPSFQRYLRSRDNRMALASPLWLTASGNVPTRSFFIRRLRLFFDTDVAGQSMRAGGATLLAECGSPPQIIQSIGRWSSEAFKIYVRKNPVILQAMLYSRQWLSS